MFPHTQNNKSDSNAPRVTLHNHDNLTLPCETTPKTTKLRIFTLQGVWVWSASKRRFLYDMCTYPTQESPGTASAAAGRVSMPPASPCSSRWGFHASSITSSLSPSLVLASCSLFALLDFFPVLLATVLDPDTSSPHSCQDLL